MKELAQNRFARFARIAVFFDGAYRVGLTANRMKQGGLAANPSISLLMCHIANRNTRVYNSTFVLFIQAGISWLPSIRCPVS